MRTDRAARSMIGLAALAAAWSIGAAASAGGLDDVKQKGRLVVAVYNEFPPFSDDGKGLDVDLARALAAKLGVTAEILTFRDGEKVEDDLRNVVWKGHYLRKEQLADVMLHVPVDPTLARKAEQVRILAPYYAERLVVARNRNRIPNLVTLEVFTQEKIGVQAETVEDNYLSASFGGALRPNVVHFATAADAAAALRRNEVAAIMGREVAIEAGLGDAAKEFAIAPVATPGLSLTGWNIGLAVKADRPELADALDHAMAELLREGVVQRLFASRGLTYAEPRAPAAQPRAAAAN